VLVDYPSHKRVKVIIGKKGMYVCVCGGISVTILSPGISSSVDYQQIIKAKARKGASERARERDRQKHINDSPTFISQQKYRSTI
jgi:hypothetical protein